jgi:major membrane immunogen (membrane-anchored lipoprotein)
MRIAWSLVAIAALLVACGEKPQALVTVTKDVAPYNGTGKAFADGDWKQGDKISWESHMKARTQRGQNDYGKMN